MRGEKWWPPWLHKLCLIYNKKFICSYSCPSFDSSYFWIWELVLSMLFAQLLTSVSFVFQSISREYSGQPASDFVLFWSVLRQCELLDLFTHMFWSTAKAMRSLSLFFIFVRGTGSPVRSWLSWNRRLILLRFDPFVFQIAPGELVFPFDLMLGVTICDVRSSWCGPSLSTGQGLDFDLVLCWLFHPSAHAPSTHPISLLVLMLFYPHIDFCSHLVRTS
jgi:hypothetical protein